MKNSAPAHGVPLSGTLWSTAALVISFLFAIGLDAIFRLLRAEAQSTFHVLPGYLFQAATPVLMAAVILALTWLLFVKLEPSRLSAAVFLAAGLIVLALYFSQFFPFPLPFRKTIIGQIRFLVLDLGTRSNLFHLASFWTVAGLAALLRRHPPAAPRPQRPL